LPEKNTESEPEAALPDNALLLRLKAALEAEDIGAADSILDICLVCALFVKLSPARFVCSPLPVADGGVFCAHGLLPAPAPAVLEMLDGVPVCGFPACGETVTPTALALLKTLKAEFGPWPGMVIRRRALVYGGKVFEQAVNGAIWAFGEAHGLPAENGILFPPSC
jgi:uncharacterized protein (DUF111 family)